MAAFLDFLSAFAIWFYIGGVVVILFGIKMLVDSRHMARTTLFTLEQERANDRAFQAIIVMFLAVLFIGAVLGINTFIAPVRPTPEAVTANSTIVPFTPPVILPTFTAAPTATPVPPTAAPTATTAKDVPTVASAQPTPVPPTPVPTKTIEPPTPVPPTVPPLTYPKPALGKPPNGEKFTSGFLQLIWGQDQLPSQLPDDQFYRVVVNYTDRNSKQAVTLQKCTHNSTVDSRQWGTLGNVQGNSADILTWNVVIVQVPSRQASDCDGGTGSPLSPVSDTWTLSWH